MTLSLLSDTLHNALDEVIGFTEPLGVRLVQWLVLLPAATAVTLELRSWLPSGWWLVWEVLIRGPAALLLSWLLAVVFGLREAPR